MVPFGVWMQEVVHKGHRKYHGLKFRATCAPDGMITTLFGPIESRRHNVTMLTQTFNAQMSKSRISVEWGFGKLVSLFAHLDFWKQLKVYKQPLGIWYTVAAVLTNAHTCIYGSQSGAYFDCTPPSLEQYFALPNV